MAAGRAEIEIVANDSRLASGLARAASKMEVWAVGIARRTGRVMSTAWSALKFANKKTEFSATAKDAVAQGAGNLMSAGVGNLIEAANGVRTFERNLVRFQITANKTPASMRAMRDDINAVSRATGVAKDELLAGGQAYLDITGDVDGAGKAIGSFARIAQASDTQMGDIANAAAAMQDSMHIDPSEIEAVFSGLINQGKAGAVTLKNMAGEFPALLSKFARFGVTGKEGVGQLGAMFQVVRKGFGSAEEASTGLQAMMGGMIKHADRFAKAGVQIFDVGKNGVKTLRPMSKIIEEIGKSDLAKDPQLLNKAFGRGEGEQAYQMGKNHLDMLRQQEEAYRDVGVVERDLAAFTTSDAGRMDLALNRVKVAIAEIFTPERITSFTNAVEGLADKIGTVADGVGRIGEGFGKLFGLGASIRGQLSGNGNGFDAGVVRDRMMGVVNAKSPAERKRAELLYKSALANHVGYDKSVDYITGGEINDRSSPESLRRAVFARFSKTKSLEGGMGEHDAGKTYLTGAGFKSDQQQLDFLEKTVTELVKQQTDAIAKTLKDGLDWTANVKAQTDAITKSMEDGLAAALVALPPPVLHLGDNQVARAVSQAKSRRHVP